MELDAPRLSALVELIRERVPRLIDDVEVIGDPVGREALLADLAHEMIPYTPEELAAIEENYRSALKPVVVPGPYGEPIEEVIAMENEGEFPTLTDQGEEETFPDPVPGDVKKKQRKIWSHLDVYWYRNGCCCFN